jgi:hypothetical protein
MASSTNRTGRVSSINYAAGTYEVTYFDRGKSVTRQINAQSNGEYKMPVVGQVVSVNHNSNGTAAATTTGTVWNKTNTPAEGYQGLYRKEYSNSKGQAYDRYDANTGVFTQYTDKRTGRNCNGEIYDEAKGAASFVAGGQIQLKSAGASASIMAKAGVGIVAGTTINLEAGTFISIEATGAMSEAVGGKRTLTVTGTDTETFTALVTRKYMAAVKDTVTGLLTVTLNAGRTQTITGDIKDTVTGNVEQEVTGDITGTVTGETTLTINGAIVSISAAGDVSITSPTKISMEAPEVSIKGGTGEVEINGVKLTQHTHSGGGSGQPNK